MVNFKREAAANLIFTFAPIVFGVLIAVVGPRPLWGGILVDVGLGCFVGAKAMNFRKGVWVSLGAKGMTKRQAVLYRIGYLLMVLGYFGVLSAAAFKIMSSH